VECRKILTCERADIKIDTALKDKHIDFTDRWIISRFQSSLKELTEAFDKFEVNNASKIVYSYVWNDFCDWFVELSKQRLYHGSEEVKSAVLTRAVSLYEEMLKLVHPFMPFITEEIWQLLDERKRGESISISLFPKLDEKLIDKNAELEILFVQEVVTAIRNIRGEMNLAPSKLINVFLKTDKVTEEQALYMKSLVRIDKLELTPICPNRKRALLQ